jgi:hypothetical protein
MVVDWCGSRPSWMRSSLKRTIQYLEKYRHADLSCDSSSIYLDIDNDHDAPLAVSITRLWRDLPLLDRSTIASYKSCDDEDASILLDNHHFGTTRLS